MAKEARTKRIVGVVLRNPSERRRGRRSGRVLLSADTGDVFRAVAAYLGCTLDELAQRMLLHYIPRLSSGLDIVFEKPPRPRRRKVAAL